MRSIYQFLYRLLYNELAWAYDAVSWAVSLGRWHAWREAALPFVRGKDVLEVGFGTGALLAQLQGRQRRVVGLEPSPAMHRIAAAKLRHSPANVPRVQGIAQSLPCADRAFDTILCAFPATYILDPATHQEFARCLRPGGRIVIVEAALAGSNPLWALLFKVVFPSSPQTKQKLAASVRGAGLSREDHLVGNRTVRPLIIVAEKKADT